MVNKAVKILWLNEYSTIKVTYNNISLVTDPAQTLSSSIGEVNYILISHEHYDHLDVRLVNELSKYSPMVISDSESGSRLRRYIPKERLRIMRPGNIYKDSNLSITAYKSVHPAVNPVTYLIEYSDCVKLFYANGSLLTGEHSQLAKLNVDLAFVPIGIAPGASPKSGSEMVHVIQPRVAIPLHGTRSNDFKSIVEARDPNIRVQIIPRDVEVVVEL
ncbi:MAG: MBL fold metallo-hydrolase [Nitrososphaeria archaeon]